MNILKKSALSCLLPLFLIVVSLVQCKKSDDVKPVHIPAGNNVDSVKTLFAGTWKFESITFQLNNITASTSNCAKTQVAAAGFPDDAWQQADEQTVTFHSQTNANYTNICSKASAQMTVSVVDNLDGTVTVTFNDPSKVYISQAFVINVADMTMTTFKAYLINEYAYTITYIFERET